jgi:hypothetical protein
MEILRSPKSKAAGGAALIGLSFLLGGCSESPAQIQQTAVEAATILQVPETARVHPGQTVILGPAKDEATRSRLVASLPLTKHIYPHGMTDSDAPSVGTMPVRLNAQVTLHGRTPNFDDDLGCDVVNLNLNRFPDKSQVYIGALALSENDKSHAMVAWPAGADGTPGNEAFLCFPVDDAPSDNGVVLVLGNTPQ